MNRSTRPAVAYYRTSSAANVGADKDSLPRQQDAVRKYAAAEGIEIVHEFYDAAVSGADPVENRPGFEAMLGYMLGNGARTILVEDASRFARDLMVQEAGYQLLQAQGIELVAVDSPDSFVSDTPTAIMVRQILGAVRQFEKAATVLKLRAARDRKRLATGRCEGNPAFGSIPVAHAQAAWHAHGKGLTLRHVATELAAAGFLARSGKPYGVSAVRRMIARQPQAA
jgi:DNA invertase Pin-like site-specific DNA recombinase